MSTPLDITPQGTSMFGYNTPFFQYFTRYPSMYMSSRYAVSVYRFTNDQKIDELLEITATAQDRNGETFVAAYKGRKLPIFGVEFRPEKTQFDQKEYRNVSRSYEAVQCARFLARYFVNESMKSQNEYQGGYHQLLFRNKAKNAIRAGSEMKYYLQ